MHESEDLPVSLIADIDKENQEDGFSYNAFPEQMDCIRNGDPDGLKATYTPEKEAYFRKIAADTGLLPYTFSYLCGCTQILACEGGLPLNRAAAVSTKYLRKASAINSLPAFLQLLQQMQLEFSNEVFLHKRFNSGNAAVNDCLRYIYEHVNEPVRISDLSRISGYSPSRLQHLFTRYIGHSVSEQIRLEKIEKACFLLKHTDLTCAAISQKLSFCSQSYFITRFKKEKGITPDGYRRQSP